MTASLVSLFKIVLFREVLFSLSTELVFKRLSVSNKKVWADVQSLRKAFTFRKFN